jgi:hypothetical protein
MGKQETWWMMCWKGIERKRLGAQCRCCFSFLVRICWGDPQIFPLPCPISGQESNRISEIYVICTQPYTLFHYQWMFILNMDIPREKEYFLIIYISLHLLKFKIFKYLPQIVVLVSYTIPNYNFEGTHLRCVDHITHTADVQPKHNYLHY